MKLPAGSATIDEGVALLKQRYDRIRRFVLAEIEQLGNSGFADQRWCAIARTDIEKGFLALMNAMPDARDGREYGKLPTGSGDPAGFTPPVDPEVRRVGNDPGHPPQIEWKDVPGP